MKLDEALKAVLAGRTLAREEARAVFATALSEDSDPVTLGGLLVAMAQRGEASEEICGAAEAMRAAARRFEHEAPAALDTCGTGGDGTGGFNLSTAAAIVACAAGAQVIKHGNRSVSSRCGSADLLEALGLPLELTPAQARRVFDEVGIVFLFAPAWHPAMRFAGPVRRSLGVRTIFNLLGPLCSPGGVRRQLLGVADPARLDDFASALEGLGHVAAYVVHGAGGADELTLESGNQLRAVGAAPAISFEAAELGLTPAPLSALAGGDAVTNRGLLEHILKGEGGALFDAVLLNTAAALVVGGQAASAAEGVERARDAVLSGAATKKLAAWIAVSERAAEAQA